MHTTAKRPCHGLPSNSMIQVSALDRNMQISASSDFPKNKCWGSFLNLQKSQLLNIASKLNSNYTILFVVINISNKTPYPICKIFVENIFLMKKVG